MNNDIIKSCDNCYNQFGCNNDKNIECWDENYKWWKPNYLTLESMLNQRDEVIKELVKALGGLFNCYCISCDNNNCGNCYWAKLIDQALESVKKLEVET